MQSSFINVRPPQSLLARSRPGDQIGGFTRGGAANQVTNWGIFSNHTVTAPTLSQGSDATGDFIQASTDAIINSEAYISRSISLSYRTGYVFQFKFKLDSVADIRFFAGTSTTVKGFLSADSDFFSSGLSFSTVNGDTNWQFLSQDNGAPVRIDSGVPATNDVYTIEVDYIPSAQIRYRLFDSLFNLVAEGLQTTTLPTTTATFNWTFGVSTQAAVTKTLKYYYAEGIRRITS